MRMTPERPEPAIADSVVPGPVVPVVPTATYRLQLQPEFPFRRAEAAVPYLASLGVSHLHLSPVLEAVPGSTHGYDVVDHTRVRAELGGEEGLRSLARTAREHGLGLVVDIVPNHMAMAPRHNHALWEVLREGPQSPYARWFDIDWDAQGGRLLLPVLGDRLGAEIGELKVDGDILRYYDHVFPLREGTAQLPMPQLLDAQWYRPAWWRLARTELNYRRFFSISELIGVRVEDPEVFAATHVKILQLVADGVIDGLRVDHPDGLADPDAYLRRLHEATGGRWTVVEKILADGEPLPPAWPVAGTTGYDALRHVDGLFTDEAGASRMLGRYRRFAGPQADRGGHWESTVRRAAYKVITYELATEVERLTREVSALCAAAPDPAARDHAPWALGAALRELLVRLEVYRPYPSTDASLVVTERAAAEARSAFRVPEEAHAVDFVRALLLGRDGDGPGRPPSGPGSRRRRRRCAPSRWRTRRSTAMCRCCRRTRWAAIRAGPRCPRTTSTPTARACSATGPPPEPSCRPTTPNAARTCAPPSRSSPSARRPGPRSWRKRPRRGRGSPTRRWRGPRGRRCSGSARPPPRRGPRSTRSASGTPC